MLEKQETEFQPLTSISSRNVCRASERATTAAWKATRYSWPLEKDLAVFALPLATTANPPPATFPSRLFIRETALRNETKAGGGVGSTRSKETTAAIGRAVGPRTTLLSSRVGWLLASNGEVTDCLGKSRVQEHPFLVPPPTTTTAAATTTTSSFSSSILPSSALLPVSSSNSLG